MNEPGIINLHQELSSSQSSLSVLSRATCEQSEVVVGVAYQWQQTIAGRSKTVVINPSTQLQKPHRGPITPDSKIIIIPLPTPAAQ
jgi:hypothetical protein